MSDIRRNHRRLRLATGLIGAVALFGGGVAFGSYLAEDDRKSAEAARLSSVRTHDLGEITVTPQQEQAARASLASRVGVDEATRTAVAAVPGPATAAELRTEQGGLVWEVEVLDGDDVWHAVTVDAGTGRVLRSRADFQDDDAAANARAAKAALVPLPDAVDVAVAAVGGGAVTSAELDAEFRDGVRLHWKVEVQGVDARQHDVFVDAVVGRVLDSRVGADT
ncbi:PepSY domain-containing protein [Streptomyces sp. NPDC051940]|uniref:PepSY domain-containing protein n=1 Tax=Streptomyces sp. NPDC051940 TaxID=3155675 RepID=UPI00341A7518